MSSEAEQQVSGAGYLMSEDNLARRVRYEMDRRGWSQERMSKEMTEAGFPIHQTSIGKIVSPGRGKRRAISVDDAIGFAKVLGMPLLDLLIPVETVLDGQLRSVLERILELVEQRSELEREMSGLVRQMLEITKELDQDQVAKIYGRDNAGRVNVFVEELGRWGQRVLAAANAPSLKDMPDDQALDLLNKIISGEYNGESLS